MIRSDGWDAQGDLRVSFWGKWLRLLDPKVSVFKIAGNYADIICRKNVGPAAGIFK